MDEAYTDDDTKTGHCVEAKTGHCGEAKTGHCGEAKTGHCGPVPASGFRFPASGFRFRLPATRPVPRGGLFKHLPGGGSFLRVF